ncbi:MAG TPA: ArsR family transcriptional regulator, partial [Candidatus Aenigmarchaeota archaeon]|nr:ArsR family transcriptional regulator [Candidatus Aenigmarchaeota archaeon]
MVKIFELLARKVPSKLILFFLNNPSRSVTQSQLVKITKLSKPSVSVWLKKLVKSRLIERDVQAGRMTYKLVDSPVTRQLKILKVVSTLYPLLKDFDVDVYLFGSHARGEDDENSDVD